jgi:hypothetical protein
MQVKKKRRGNKVGYGRDEDVQEDENPPAVVDEIPQAPLTRTVSSDHIKSDESISKVLGPEIALSGEKSANESPSKQTSDQIKSISEPEASEIIRHDDEGDNQSKVVSSSMHSVGNQSSSTPPKPVAGSHSEKRYSFFDIFRRSANPDDNSGHESKPDNYSNSHPESKRGDVAPAERVSTSRQTIMSPNSGGLGNQLEQSSQSAERHLTPSETDPSSAADMFSGMQKAGDSAPKGRVSSEADKPSSRIVPSDLPSRAPAPSTQPQKIQGKVEKTQSETVLQSAPSVTMISKTSLPVSKNSSVVQKEDLTKTIRKLGAEVLSQIVVKMESLAKERWELKEAVRVGLADISSFQDDVLRMQRRISDIEKEQIVLSNSDDFEGAAALSEPLEKLSIDVKNAQSKILEAQSKVESCKEKLVNAQASQDSVFQNDIRGLQNLLRQQEEEWEKYAKDWNQVHATDETRVQAEEARVELERTHVERELATLNEESQVIETLITGQTEALTKSKAGFEDRLHGVLAEIAELELALAAKKAEELELREDLKATSAGITDVRRKYERQLQRIYDRRVAVDAAYSECKIECETIRKEREQLEGALLEFDISKREVDNWVRHTTDEIECCSEFLDFLNSLASLPTSLSQGIDAQSEKASRLIELRQIVADSVNDVSRAYEESTKTENLLQALAAEAEAISVKLPLLEQDKKAYASSKQFKEAAVVAKDIKQLTSRKDEIEVETATASDNASRIRLEIQEKEKRLYNDRDALRNAEREFDELKFLELVQNIRSVKKWRDRILQKSSDLVVYDAALRLVEAELTVCVCYSSIFKYLIPNVFIFSEIFQKLRTLKTNINLSKA